MVNKQNLFSRLRRGTVEAFILRVAGVGLLFLMHSLLGRKMGADGYGVFSYGLAMASVLAAIVPLGWSTALMRFVAQYVEKREWALLHGIVRRAHQVTLAISILVAFCLFVATYLLSLSAELLLSLRFAAVLTPLLAFVGLRSKAFQGLQRVKSSIILEELILPFIVIVGVAILTLTTTISIFSILALYVSASLIVLFSGSIWLWRSIPTESRVVQPRFQTRAWMHVAGPMVFGNLGQIVLNRVGILILGLLVSTQAVGLYSAANRIANLNIFALAAVNTVAPQMLAAAYHGGRLEQFKTIMRGSIVWATLGALPLFLVMLIWPRQLLSFFGTEFSEGALLLQILAIGQFINAMTGPAGFGLLMIGRERSFAWIMGIIATGNVVGHLIAIPLAGALGAAVVTATSVILQNSLMFIEVQRIYKLEGVRQ